MIARKLLSSYHQLLFFISILFSLPRESIAVTAPPLSPSCCDVGLQGYLTPSRHTTFPLPSFISRQAERRSRGTSFVQSLAQDAADFSTEVIAEAEKTAYAPVVTVDALDVDRFTGRWFQV